jgi:hypothetical protein
MFLMLRPQRLTLRQIGLGISPDSSASRRASEQGAVDIEALDTLERAEHRRQKQLCVPLVPSDTYWYLSAVPELMTLAARRLEARFGDQR